MNYAYDSLERVSEISYNDRGSVSCFYNGLGGLGKVSDADTGRSCLREHRGKEPRATEAITSTAKPGFIISRADIMTQRSVDLSMRMSLRAQARDFLATICLRIVIIVQ